MLCKRDCACGVHLIYKRYEGEGHGLHIGLCFPKGNVDRGTTNVGHCPQFVIDKASAGNNWNVFLLYISDSASRPIAASSAVFGLIKSDADTSNTVINVVSDAIVKKLLDNLSFLDTLAKIIISSGLMNEVKQELYDSCALDNGRTNDEVRNLEQRVASLETANKALRDDSDAQDGKNSTVSVTAYWSTASQRIKTARPRQYCHCAIISWA